MTVLIFFLLRILFMSKSIHFLLIIRFIDDHIPRRIVDNFHFNDAGLIRLRHNLDLLKLIISTELTRGTKVKIFEFEINFKSSAR